MSIKKWQNRHICEIAQKRREKFLNSLAEKHLTFCRGHDTVCATTEKIIKGCDEDGQVTSFSESRRQVQADSELPKNPSLPSRCAEC